MIGKIILAALIIAALATSSYLLYMIYQDNYSPEKNLNVNYTQLESQASYPSSELQFYPNMRFDHNNLSYTIGGDCEAKKREEMVKAFNYLENKTRFLGFYEAVNGEIEVNCGEEYQKGDYFVAGEGGPEGNISQTGIFNIIYKGRIILLSSESCTENVALHELLHVLGFNHSESKTSIMYPVTGCNQALTNDIVLELDRLYSIQALPDMYFESLNGTKKGSYLNLDFVIKNQGITTAENVSVILYADDKEKDKFNFDGIGAGTGRIFSVKNERIFSASNLKLVIVAGQELDDKNNIAELKVS